MLLRVLAVLGLLGILVSGAFAAPASFPGSKVVFEMTFTEKDFLPAVKQFIPAMPGVMSQVLGAKMPAGNEEQKAKIVEIADTVAKNLVESLSGLQSITVAGYAVKSPDPDKIADFYLTKLGLTKGWNQTLRFSDPEGNGSIRLYVKPDLEETFGLYVGKSEYATIQSAGKIDVAKIAKTVTDMIPLAIQIAEMERPKPMPIPEPMTVDENTPVPTPVPDGAEE